jgi:hypothetical protein
LSIGGTYKWKVHNGKIENDPEQLAHTSENSPALTLSETDSGPVESKSSQTGATKFDLEPTFQPPILNRILNLHTLTLSN